MISGKYSFTECFALPALTAMRSDRMTDARSAAARALHVASALEKGGSAEDAAALARRMFRKTIADAEKDAVRSLMEKGLLIEGPDMASLEMVNAGARCWKAEPGALSAIMDPVREHLASGALGDDEMALIWLLREAGSLPFLLTQDEMEQVGSSSQLREFPLWGLMFGKKLELGNEKRRPDVLPKAEDRTGGAFVEGIFLPEGDRMEGLMALLRERGHGVTTAALGDRPLMRIDGCLYRADLHARKSGRLPIEGISIRPACL